MYIPFRFVNNVQPGTYETVDFKFGMTCYQDSLQQNENDSYIWTTRNIPDDGNCGGYACYNAFGDEAFEGQWNDASSLHPDICAPVRCGRGYNPTTGEETLGASVVVQIS